MITEDQKANYQQIILAKLKDFFQGLDEVTEEELKETPEFTLAMHCFLEGCNEGLTLCKKAILKRQ